MFEAIQSISSLSMRMQPASAMDVNLASAMGGTAAGFELPGGGRECDSFTVGADGERRSGTASGHEQLVAALPPWRSTESGAAALWFFGGSERSTSDAISSATSARLLSLSRSTTARRGRRRPPYQAAKDGDQDGPT